MTEPMQRNPLIKRRIDQSINKKNKQRIAYTQTDVGDDHIVGTPLAE